MVTRAQFDAHKADPNAHHTPPSAATAVPIAITEGVAGAVGTSVAYAREDHEHPSPSTWTPSAHKTTHEKGGVDEITSLGAISADEVTLASLTADPALAAGKIWFRSDLGRILQSPDGVITKQLAHTDEIGIIIERVGGSAAITGAAWGDIVSITPSRLPCAVIALCGINPDIFEYPYGLAITDGADAELATGGIVAHCDYSYSMYAFIGATQSDSGGQALQMTVSRNAFFGVAIAQIPSGTTTPIKLRGYNPSTTTFTFLGEMLVIC